MYIFVYTHTAPSVQCRKARFQNIYRHDFFFPYECDLVFFFCYSFGMLAIWHSANVKEKRLFAIVSKTIDRPIEFGIAQSFRIHPCLHHIFSMTLAIKWYPRVCYVPKFKAETTLKYWHDDITPIYVCCVYPSTGARLVVRFCSPSSKIKMQKEKKVINMDKIVRGKKQRKHWNGKNSGYE